MLLSPPKAVEIAYQSSPRSKSIPYVNSGFFRMFGVFNPAVTRALKLSKQNKLFDAGSEALPYVKSYVKNKYS